jgi:hypothetical protein
VFDEKDDVEDADRNECGRKIQQSLVLYRRRSDKHEEEHDSSEVQVQLDLETTEELVLIHQVADDLFQVEQVLEVVHIMLFT